MANKIIQLKDKDSNNLYPLILGNSIPDNGIEISKLSKSVHDKINEDITNAVNVEKTRAEGAESTLDGKITAEQTRAANAENALDGRVDTLEEAVGTGGSVDSRIASAVATETSRAQEAEANRYTKNETYTKEEVNNLITTPNQEYVSVTATEQTTVVTDVLPATGAADTIYRVGNWDGSQYNDSVFSEYAWNGSVYIKLSTKSQIGEVYDISANHADTKYADLAAALGTNGANVPQSLRKGGMSVKFVQTSDNKYVQYRLMTQNWSTTENNWQGVDEEPLYGSKNLVDSNSIYNTMGLIEVTFPVKNMRIDPSGAQVPETSWECTDYIKLIDITVKYIHLRNINNITSCVFFYNREKTPISGITTDGIITTNMFTVPKDAYYVRFSRAFTSIKPGFSVFIANVNLTDYELLDNSIVQLKYHSNDIFPRSKAEAIETTIDDYFTLPKEQTTNIYLTDGSIAKYSKFSMSELFPIKNGIVLKGVLVMSTVNICAIVWFDNNRNFISGIYKKGASTQLYNIDTSIPEMSIPQNAKYFAIQAPTFSPWYEKLSLFGCRPLDTIIEYIKSEIDNLDDAVFGHEEEIQLLWPRVIYNVGNNIEIGKNNFPRNYSTCLYIDNFLPNRLTYEPKVFFEDKKILKAIPCYEPPMPNFTGLNDSWETPKMNNGQNLYTETIALKINNGGTMQTRNIQNRCVLNSSAKNKRIAILCIGDSITFGQNAYFTESPNKANYTMLLSEMFKKDNLQEGSGYEFDTIGTIKYNRIFSYNGQDYNIPCFNEGYSGTTMQQTGLFTNPKFLDENNNFSFNNWLNKYRTRDDDGNQLYFDENGATTGVGGNYGFYKNGTQSSFRIGTKVTDVTLYNVYKPTHIFLFHCTNGAISKSNYDTFISYVRDVFPDAFIGLGAPHVAGTYYPSYWPQYCNCERWNNMLNYRDADNKQYLSETVLLQIADDSSYEDNNVFVLSTFFVNPSADAISGLAVSHPYNDFIQDGDIYMPKGQCPQAHVGGKAHAAYAYQLYGWTKWTSVNRDS